MSAFSLIENSYSLLYSPELERHINKSYSSYEAQQLKLLTHQAAKIGATVWKICGGPHDRKGRYVLLKKQRLSVYQKSEIIKYLCGDRQCNCNSTTGAWAIRIHTDLSKKIPVFTADNFLKLFYYDPIMKEICKNPGEKE